jgi:hypothetical protein
MATDTAFLGALAGFEERRAYFNLQGDALVPLGSAAFFVSPRSVGWGLFEKPGIFPSRGPLVCLHGVEVCNVHWCEELPLCVVTLVEPAQAYLL